MHHRSTRPVNSLLALGVAALLLAVGAPVSSAQEVERYALSGDDVAIYNLVGELSVEPGSGGSVVIELLRGGEDSRELRVETGRLGGRQALRVLYPADRVVYPQLGRGSRTTLRVRDDGTFFDDGGGRGRRVTIGGSGDGLRAYADVRVRVPEGRKLSIYFGVGRARVANVNGRIHIQTGSGAIEAESTRGSLRLDAGSGRVSVRGAEGDVEVDTGAGSVEVRGVRGGRLLVDTGSGSVEGGDIAVSELEVDTGSGSIHLEGVSARRARLDTGSGHVHLALVSDVDDLEIDTGAGSVALTVPPSISAQFELDTGSGGIDVDLPLQVIRGERGYLLARSGSSRGSIRIDTGSGRIRVRGS